jgi:hypothetical protein
VPVCIELEVFTVRVEDPEPATEVGEKLAVAPEGSPVTLKLTFPLNPTDGVTLTLKVVLFPRETTREVGVAVSEKAFTTSFACVE